MRSPRTCPSTTLRPHPLPQLPKRLQRSSRADAMHTGIDSLSPDARILVICVARVGDTLLATPALRALRAAVPRGSLTVLAHPKRRALLEHLPFIDHLGGIEKHSASW